MPIIPDILRLLWSVWSEVPPEEKLDVAMLWAACCLFLRAREFTCSSWQDMLSPRDVSVDSRSSPSVVSVLLRRSKADPFSTGVTIHLGKTNQSICPVGAILGYLHVCQHGQRPGPLFLFRDNTPLFLKVAISSPTGFIPAGSCFFGLNRP